VSDTPTAGTQQAKLITRDRSECRYCPLLTVGGGVCSRCDPQRDWTSGTEVTQAAFFLLERHDDLGPNFPYVFPETFEEVVYEETVRVLQEAIRDLAPGFERVPEMTIPKPTDGDGPEQASLEGWA